MSNKLTVLIVEDDSGISNFISTILDANEYRTIKTDKGHEALSIITSHCPDLILLDLGLPDMDGLEILRSVREWSQVPIVVVSARGHEREKVMALDLGADDYITKPFGTAELLARIRTALRHNRRVESGDDGPCGKFCCGGLNVDFDRRLVILDGSEIHLTQIEYKIVTLLAQYAGRVLTYDYIMKDIWGPYAPRENQILRVNMANIRRKLETNPAEPRYIMTEIGVGYRMSDE